MSQLILIAPAAFKGTLGPRQVADALAAGARRALPDKVVMARPTGVGRGITTYTIPIEGRDEWLAAAGLRA